MLPTYGVQRSLKFCSNKKPPVLHETSHVLDLGKLIFVFMSKCSSSLFLKKLSFVLVRSWFSSLEGCEAGLLIL